tara:strand:+ start:5129 stop:6232 length:1104 start_codon:yes stop_codon:yes gene_type:complete
MEINIENNHKINEDISAKVQFIIENQNPFKNFKLENYKYAQLHKKIAPKNPVSDFKYHKDINDLSLDLSTQSLKSVNLRSALDNWNFYSTDSYFRVESLIKRPGALIPLDDYEQSIFSLDISKMNENVMITKNKEKHQTIILLNTNVEDELPKSIFIDLSDNANLDVIQYNISNHKSFLYFESKQGDDSKLNFITFQSNNVHTRNEYFASLGSQCHFELSGLNFDNIGVNDNYSFIQHLKPSSSSREVFKSIVDKGAITNFQGKIYVDAIAQKTDGYQMSRSLLLDDISKANNKPELEIYADDVKCSHGSTVSQIDKNQIYYFNSRGINKKEAKRILQKAFLSETLENISSEDLKDFSLKLLDNLIN